MCFKEPEQGDDDENNVSLSQHVGGCVDSRGKSWSSSSSSSSFVRGGNRKEKNAIITISLNDKKEEDYRQHMRTNYFL